MADVVLKDASGNDVTYEGIDNVTLLNTEGNTETFVSERLIQNQIQADWNQTDDTAVDYIKNKPEIFETEDELPVVTTEDDGKLLGVLNGEWTIVDAPENAPAETELPEVTTDDDGKILGVVGGEWAATEAPETQKQADMAQTDSTSADFVKNQYFGVLPDLIPTQEYGFKTEGGWAGDIKAFSIPKGLTQLVEGEQYLVQWGDTSQVLTAKLFDDGEGGLTNTVLYIGNLSILFPAAVDGVTDTGEPFVITENNTANTIGFATNDLAIEKLVAGAKLANNEKKLDPKWLPDGLASAETQQDHENRITALERNSGGSGGTTTEGDALPEVTEADNGKILGVVNGAWTKMDAPKGNVTVTEVDVFPTEMIAFAPQPNTPLYYGYLGNLFSLIAGETYYVVWDGTAYECVAQEITSTGDTGIAIGNLSLGDMGEDTGEPFTIAYALNEKYTAALTLSTDSEHDIRIYQKVENGGGGQTGFIEKEVLVEWDTSVMPTVTFDIPELNHTLYKLVDATPTKEQLLAAEFRISSENGDSDMYTQTISETDIAVASDDIIAFQFSSIPTFGYLVCYTAGEIFVNAYGISLTITVPEAGFYQLWTIGMKFPNTLVGSMSYTITEKVDFIQSDWNQADSTQPDYIKNKPFGLGELQMQEVLPTTTIPFTYTLDFGAYVFQTTPTAEYLSIWASNWNETKFVFDGAEYICEPKYFQGIKCIGNVDALTGFGNSGEPFFFGMADAATWGQDIMLLADLATPITDETTEGSIVLHEIAVSLEQQSIIKLDPKFIENIDYETQVINKPFGSIPSGTVVFNGVVDCNQQDGDSEYFGMIDQIDFVDGVAYLVEIDGTSFNAAARLSGGGAIGIVLDDCLILNGISPGQTIVILGSQGAHSLKIQTAEEAIKKLDAKYLPDGIGGGTGGLPEVTTSDNGKVMTVVNGTWVATTPEAGLPTVSTTDNGKVLKVVNGAWSTANEDEIEDELPEVTADDDGKVLTAEGGVWVAKSSPIPSVSADDNGKFLRVVDGVIALATVQNAEEVRF